MAVYAPALMLQGGDLLDTVYVVGKALLAVGLWGAGAIGFLFAPLNWFERAVAIGAAAFLIVALPLTDEIGFAACALFLVWHGLRARRHRTLQPAK